MGTIVVTGAASGIGAATCVRLEKEGQRVIGVDRSPGVEVVADLGSQEGRRLAVEAIREASGDRLEGVVSAAGLGPYDEAGPVARVNYFGAMAMLDDLLDLLARGSAPAAVGISSVGAVFTQLLVPGFVEACLAGDEESAVACMEGHDGNTAYVCAKHALALAVKQRAPTWGERGVRLNAVAPGSTETAMLARLHDDPALGPPVRALPIPLGRTAPASELASAIVFLLGPDASFVHGTVLKVDGGSEAVIRPDVI